MLADETSLNASVALIELVGSGRRSGCVVFIVRVIVEIVKIIEKLFGESQVRDLERDHRSSLGGDFVLEEAVVFLLLSMGDGGVGEHGGERSVHG